MKDILAGYTKSSGNGEEDIWFIKTDELGNELWDKTYGGFGSDVTYSVQRTNDSGYMISGFTNSFSSGNGGLDVWLIKTDGGGNVTWDKRYGGLFDDLSFYGQQTSDSGYIATGSTYSYGNGQSDFYVIRLDSDGSTSVENTVYSKPDKFMLIQNYPNPFNPTTTINYSIPERSYVSLKIYDVLGNEVVTLVSEEKPAGSYEIEFNANGMPSGIYLYQLKAGSYSVTKKMLLIK
jgi:hypothetical protein